MKRRFVGLSLTTSLLFATMLCSSPSMAADLTTDMIYTYAEKGEIKQLLKYLHSGYSIESVDEKGNTALCQAVLNEDKVVVKRLLGLGAKPWPACMQRIPREKLRNVGLLSSKQVYTRDSVPENNKPSMPTPAVWKTNTFLTIAGLGGIAGIIALASGGGGSSSSDDEDETTTLSTVTSIPADKANRCTAAGYKIINGVCTKVITDAADKGEAVSEQNRATSPYNLAELGGDVTNSGDLSYTGSSTGQVVAMQANGVKASAYDEDAGTVKVTDSKVSTATNKGTLTLTETSSDNKGVIGLYGTSAGSVYNKGTISITSLSENDSAAILVEKHGDSETPETGTEIIDGANVTNDGVIQITDNGKGLQSVSGIDAKGRNVINNGIIDIVIGKTTEEVILDNHPHGEANGIYSKNVVNKGTISVKADTASTNPYLVDTDVFLIRGTSNADTTVANDGIMNIDLTDIAYGIKGIWSEPTTATTVKNTGTINVTGKLYNVSTIDKQVYLMGINGSSAAGNPTIRNVGNIVVGTTEKPIDVSMGGLFYAMYAPYGTMTNTKAISFNLHADPTTAMGNAFRSYVMHLGSGTLTNDGDINYTFNNLNSEGKAVPTSEKIELTAIETVEANVTNNAELTATLTGSAAAGSNYYGILGTAKDAEVKNNGSVTVESSMDNMALTGIQTTKGDSYNSSSSEINLKSSGKNANLYGLMGLGKGNNSGSIILTHDGGSADEIQALAGGNTGYIQINANDMTGSTNIFGVGTKGGGSDIANSKIDIYLRGTTSGSVTGQYFSGTASEAPTSTSAGEINIYATDTDREGDLNVVGIDAITSERKLIENELLSGEKYSTYETGDMTAINAGTINLNVNASNVSDYKTLVYGMEGIEANITNSGIININADMGNSTNYMVVGMDTVDMMPDYRDVTKQDPLTYIARNTGTININLKANQESSLLPFGAVGMMTNSIAINDVKGNIVMNVTGNAKSAGMVAYEGGMIINAGTITYTGTADNFTPMYAEGSKTRTTLSETRKTKKVIEDGKEVDKSYIERTTTQTEYYGTVYNYGNIVITDTDVPGPQGNGYYKATNKDKYYDTTKGSEGQKDMSNIISSDNVIKAWARQVKDGTQAYDEVSKTWDPTYPTLTLNTEKTTNTEERGFKKFPSTPPLLMAVAPTATKPTATSKSTKQVKNMLINDGMKYVSEKGGVFSAKGYHLSGDVVAGSSLVQGSNQDTYLATGMGSGAVIGDGDATDLGLSSDTVMFNATYSQNATNSSGLDIVLSRKSFDELVDNSSLANFLEDNYNKGNNVDLFDKLKSFSALNQLTDTLSKMTSNNIFSKFNFEDMTMMRELNYNLNQHLFHNNESSFSVAGEVMPLGFKGDSVSKSKYSLYNKRSGNTSLGLGIAFSDIRSGESHDDSSDRREMMYQMIMPIGFKMLGLNFITSPRVGYARANYDRTGSDKQNFNGTYEKQLYGLMNEARFPVKILNWVLEASAELNAIGYKQKGHEDKKDYSLNINSQNTFSLETGFGFNLSQNKELGKNERLNLNLGASVYHEFADPYQLDIGMNGMDGSFTLRDEDRSDNRAVLRMGLDYTTKDYSLYGSFLSYIDHEVRSSIKTGLKVKF